jgi:hypothetical protein
MSTNMRAPSAFANFQVSSGTNYSSAADAIISGVASGDIADLVKAGCVVLNGPPQQIAAAGATQGAATLINAVKAIITVCTASARGIRLPTPVSGLEVQVYSKCTQGTKVYPHVGGHIGTGATNAAAVQAGLKAFTYNCFDGVTWAVQKGA